MEWLTLLWLPIVVAAVVCFIASALAWTVLPHHNKDVLPFANPQHFKDLAQPDGAESVKPGVYMFPHQHNMSAEDETSKTMIKEGPWGTVNIWPAQPQMGPKLAASLGVFLFVTFLVAYVAAESLLEDAQGDIEPISSLRVFQLTTTVAVMAYTCGWMLNAIWFGKPLRQWLTDGVDGLAYGLITGATFAILWPS
ncbi:MAG: hypothetical protein AAGB34_00025 [Planctomycetota bacterium]